MANIMIFHLKELNFKSFKVLLDFPEVDGGWAEGICNNTLSRHELGTDRPGDNIYNGADNFLLRGIRNVLASFI